MNNIFEDDKFIDLLQNCLSNYSYDIAKLVYYLYKDDYVCGKLKNKLWYHFKNNKWIITELGPYNELSNNIVKIFEKYKLEIPHNQETITKRLKTYQDETQEIIEFYKKQNLLHEVDASVEIDAIYKEILRIINTLEG